MAFPQPATSTDNRLQDTSNRLLSLEERMSRWSVLARAVEDAIEDSSRRIATLNRRIATLQDGVNQQQKFAQEEIAKKTPEEEAGKKTAEEAASKKFVEEEFAKKTAEEEAAKKVAEEEASKKVAEEALANKAAEEEAAKKVAEEEEAAKKTADDTSKAVDDNHRKEVAQTLASKGFTVDWLLKFWRKYGVRPTDIDVSVKILTAAVGEWRGIIQRSWTTNAVVREIIIPETSEKRCCYMDLNSAAIKPGKLVSHWWGADFYGDLLCIVSDATGLRGDSLDWFVNYGAIPGEPIGEDVMVQSYWMCIFAVNQHVSICGMCNDCNIVNTSIGPDASCSVCHRKLFNPCACGSTKYQTGHVLCQMDKFDVVMAEMPDGLAVALDSQLITLERVWVVSEIGKSLSTKKPIAWHMPDDIDIKYCGPCDVPLASVRDCKASLEDDKLRILEQIETTITIDRFDEEVQSAMFPVLRNFALLNMLKGQSGANEIEAVLKRRADPNTDTGMGRSALFVAAMEGHQAVVECLLEYKANLDDTDRGGFTPINMAAEEGYDTVVSALIEAGANVDLADDTGATPVFAASRDGHDTIVKALVAVKANIDQPMNDGCTPINMAAIKGYGTVVSALIEAGANVDLADDTGNTPTFMASCYGYDAVVKSLIAGNAAIDQANNEGVTPIYLASQKGHQTIVETLVASKADIDHPTNKGNTPTWVASSKGHDAVVKSLIAANAAIDQANNEGGTPVCMASQNGHDTVVKALAAAKANIDQPTKAGITPLIVASHNGLANVVRQLLFARATLDAKFGGRWTALGLAKKKSHQEIVDLLKAAGALE